MAHKLLLNWLTQTMTECGATSLIKVPGWVRKSVVAFVSCLTVVHFEIVLCTEPGSLLPWPGVGHERIPSGMLSDPAFLSCPRLCFFTLWAGPCPCLCQKSMNNWSPKAKPVLSPAAAGTWGEPGQPLQVLITREKPIIQGKGPAGTANDWDLPFLRREPGKAPPHQITL